MAETADRELTSHASDSIPHCQQQAFCSPAQLLTLRLPAGVYPSLLRAEAADSELEIVRDLSRTYPSHVFFQQRQGPGQRSLFNVLKAYAVYDRQVCSMKGLHDSAGLSACTRSPGQHTCVITAPVGSHQRTGLNNPDSRDCA